MCSVRIVHRFKIIILHSNVDVLQKEQKKGKNKQEMRKKKPKICTPMISTQVSYVEYFEG